MPESRITKGATKLIKALDKLSQDLRKGAEKCLEASRELRGEKKEDEEEKGE